MKQILLALTLILFCNANAQNYQTIKSNQINYFGTDDLSYILATRTDSVKLSGLDSVFYSFKTARENDMSLAGCEWILGANWYGDKVIIQPNGDNLFFNKDLDTIRIKTQAALNDTFLVYVYPGGLDSIYGWVSSIAPSIIFGVPDMLKTIDLFSTTVLNITNPQILIGENYGFIEFFAPYSFPEPYPSNSILVNYTNNFNLVGHEFPRTGITKPLRGEIYDFEVGDRFIYNYGEWDFSGYEEVYYKERTVLNKTLYGVDSVDYLIHDTTKYMFNAGGGFLPATFSGGSYTARYKNLLSLNDTLLPEEYSIYQSSWNYLFFNSCQRLEELKLFEGSFSLVDYPASNCMVWNSVSDGYFYYPYIAGIGALRYSGKEPGYALFYDSELLYYSKVLEDTCGTNSYMALDDFTKTTPSFLVYPNPTNADVTIRLNVEPTSNYQITITDLSGKIVYSENVNSNLLLNGYSLPTSQLESGIYLIALNDGENRFVEKLVKE